MSDAAVCFTPDRGWHLQVGPVTRALLRLRDEKLRRCSWCGEWAYDKQPCGVCHTPVEAR